MAIFHLANVLSTYSEQDTSLACVGDRMMECIPSKKTDDDTQHEISILNLTHDMTRVEKNELFYSTHADKIPSVCQVTYETLLF